MPTFGVWVHILCSNSQNSQTNHKKQPQIGVCGCFLWIKIYLFSTFFDRIERYIWVGDFILKQLPQFWLFWSDYDHPKQNSYRPKRTPFCY